MTALLGITGLVLIFCGTVFAQSSLDESCPAISVTGPPGIVLPGEIASFSVNVDTKGKSYDLKYVWSVSDGNISSGQGTASIDVRVGPSGDLTATVEVKGLPAGCTDNASGSSWTICMAPPTVLDEIFGPLTKIPAARFDRIAETARSNPSAQIYIGVSGSRRGTSRSIARKHKILTEMIGLKIGVSRITFVNSTALDDRVKIWLVPAGSSNPVID